MSRHLLTKRLALSLLLVGAFCDTRRVDAAANDQYVLVADPPSVAIVDISDRKALASIPLNGAPTYAIAAAEANTLFVLNHILPAKGEQRTTVFSLFLTGFSRHFIRLPRRMQVDRVTSC